MTQQPSSPQSMRFAHPLVLAVAIAALVMVALVALTYAAGVAGPGPVLDIVPDPAGMLPF